MWISIQWEGKEPPSRFWLCRCHASSLAIERGPALSFLLSFPPFAVPSFFYIPSSMSFFFSSDDGEWFQLGGFRGRRVVATEFERGWRRFCRPSATRCIVSLLHSFLILRQTCVANLRKPWLPFPTPRSRIFLLFPRFLRRSFVFAVFIAQPYRRFKRTFVHL